MKIEALNKRLEAMQVCLKIGIIHKIHCNEDLRMANKEHHLGTWLKHNQDGEEDGSAISGD